VTITGTVANDKLYDGNTLATLFNIGVVTTGVGSETLILNGPLDANINFNDPNVLLANTVTASGYSLANGSGVASNYALTSTSATAAASITPRDVTITGIAANDKLYDGDTLATLSNIGSVTTNVGAETLTLTGPLAANINFNDKDVLDANLVTATGYSLADDGSFLASNYALTSTTATAAASITPATLTVTANAASRPYGAVEPAFSGSISGFVAGDTQVSATSGSEVFSTNALLESDVGSYSITGAGLRANNGNYVFIQAAGNATSLTITPATLNDSTTAFPFPLLDSLHASITNQSFCNLIFFDQCNWRSDTASNAISGTTATSREIQLVMDNSLISGGTALPVRIVSGGVKMPAPRD